MGGSGFGLHQIFYVLNLAQWATLITPSRGLRQGDPLSPYLFLMVTEGLHVLFKKAEENENIKGVSLCAAGPRVSHLLFANDSLVFCKATITECVQIQSLLFIYE